MLGTFFVVFALAMFAVFVIPDVRAAVNPLYLGIWFAMALTVGAMGVCLWILT